MKEIILTQGKIALVDDCDFEWLSQYKWFAMKGSNSPHNFYAARHAKVAGRWTTIQMHREILGLKVGDGNIVDHKNWNGLDNRRENLRIANTVINAYNRNFQSNNTSGYRGTYWNKKNKKWTVQLTIDGKFRYFGSFSDPVKAAQTYDKLALQFGLKYAVLNFPEDSI